MENSIEIIQIKVIINFDIYLGGRALKLKNWNNVLNVNRKMETCAFNCRFSFQRSQHQCSVVDIPSILTYTVTD